MKYVWHMGFLIAVGAVLLPSRVFCAEAPAPAADPLGLWTQATLYRDEWGVPHVYAQNYRALAFAFGYAQAQDHAEPMLFAYRVANGRAAMVAGEALAESDAFSVRMGHARLAEQALRDADPLTRDLCEGFALGVNAWLSEHASLLPAWAEAVRPQDVLALWHAYLMSHAPLDLPGGWRRPPAMGSGNAWAVGPSQSERGYPLLVMNPHEHYAGYFRWYEAHLAVGDYDVSGATLFGLPVLLMGHNAAAAWALSPNRPDTADVFEESLEGPRKNPNDPRLANPIEENAPALLFYSQAQPYQVQTGSGLETRYVPAFLHGRGPVLEHNGSIYSWSIGGFYQFGGLLQLVEMGRAQHLAAFQQALTLQQLPCFQIVYADRDGNIFYLYNATAGTRALPDAVLRPGTEEYARGVDWTRVQPAERAAFAWNAVYPATSLPYLLNPQSGYVQACGTPPWLATEQHALDPAQYPLWIAGEKDTFRARRVRQLLQLGRRTPRDMQAMLYDTLMPAAVELTPVLLRAAAARTDVASLHPDLPAALRLLEGWHCVAETNSSATTFYHAWWTLFREGTNTADEAALYDALLSGNAKASEAALNAAAAAVRTMRNELDTVEVPWGEVHRLRRGAREEALFGAVSGEPIFVSGDFAYTGEKWLASYGYGFAMAVELGPEPRAYSICPFGSSEHPQSPHYDDQMDLFLAKRMKHTRYLPNEVLRNASAGYGRAVTLYPQGAPAAVHFFSDKPIGARLRAHAEPPAPLPTGLVPFSQYIETQTQPPDTQVYRLLEAHVPEALAAEQALPRLALYIHRAGGGWTALEGQQLDLAARVFSGTVPQEVTFVVAGPAELRLSAPERPEALVATQTAPSQAPPRGEAASGGSAAPFDTAEASGPGSTQNVGIETEAAVEPPLIDGPVPPLLPEGMPIPEGAAPAEKVEPAGQTSQPILITPDRPRRRGEPDFPPGLLFGPAARGAAPQEAAVSTAPEEATPPAAQTEPAEPAVSPAPRAPEMPASERDEAPVQTSGPNFPQVRELVPVGKQENKRVFTFKPGEGFRELTAE